MDFILIAAGLALLFFGGEALVRGAVSISEKLGLSAILIGAVVVGFGTSTPELLVSIEAAMNNQPDIAVGNVVGSNIANVILILGLAALINPVSCKDGVILRDSMAVIFASILLFLLSFMGVISAPAGAFMFLSLIGYIFYSYKAERRKKAELLKKNGDTVHEHEAEEFSSNMGMPLSIAISVGGIAMLVYGADLLIGGATNLARSIGISEAVIGLSLVAVGTSLPELATSISAALKKHSDVIIGNILGSNLFNILSILGISAMIKPVPIAAQIAAYDIPFMLAIAAISSAIIFFFKGFGKTTGAAFIFTYVVYLVWLYMQSAV